jgi:hypothetical protein
MFLDKDWVPPFLSIDGRFLTMSISSPSNPAQKQPRLLDQVQSAVKLRHYGIRTEEAHVQWIRRYILFHDMRHPLEREAVKSRPFRLILLGGKMWLHRLKIGPCAPYFFSTSNVQVSHLIYTHVLNMDGKGVQSPADRP